MLKNLVKDLKPSSTLLINETSRRLEEQGKKIYKFGFGQSPFKGVDIPGTGMSIGVDRLLFVMMQLNQIKVDEKKPVIVCVIDRKSVV